MNQEIKYIIQASWIVLIHFVAGVLAALVFTSVQTAFVIGLIIAGVAVAIYIGLIVTDNAEPGLPLACLIFVSPVIWLTGILIWWLVRWILEGLNILQF